MVAPGGSGVEQHRNRVVVVIRHDQIGLAVAVDVGRRHRVRVDAHGEGLLGGEAGRGAPGAVVLSRTETVLSPSFATIRSGLPSPLTSAMVTETGWLPVAKVCWAAKLGVVAPGAVVLSRTETVLAAPIRDDQVGLAVAVDVGRRHRHRGAPAANVCWVAKLGVVAPGAVVLSSTETVCRLQFATIRSGLPSPLMSAAVTENGWTPVAKVCCVAKLGVKVLAAPPPPAIASGRFCRVDC